MALDHDSTAISRSERKLSITKQNTYLLSCLEHDKQICWAVGNLGVLALCELRLLKFIFSLICKILTIFIAQSHTQRVIVLCSLKLSLCKGYYL